MQKQSGISRNPEYDPLASSTGHFKRRDDGRRQAPLAFLNTRFGRNQKVGPLQPKQRRRDTSFAYQTLSSPAALTSAAQGPLCPAIPALTSIAPNAPAKLTQSSNEQSDDESDVELELIHEWYTNPMLPNNHISKLREFLPTADSQNYRLQLGSKFATKFPRENRSSQREIGI
ncbi:hypothetical protein AOQ84DRAFT_8136 [Glonium stellatum]|uniref:Uncharacterized protein n=1 Tax=Glonium stellatum TaxID=574774 RepID=A0A8E2F3W8_9PEZI|nr:hypothetical protein AOQ84DRAFT_8136 [Glonium stellatum]